MGKDTHTSPSFCSLVKITREHSLPIVTFLCKNMARNTKFCSLVFLSVLFLVVTQEAYGCSNMGQGCVYAVAASPSGRSRKMLAGFRGGLVGQTSAENGKKLANIRELRTVPSGPDPLHHNGGSPKKPRTTP